jgi:hypothetical protein
VTQSSVLNDHGNDNGNDNTWEPRGKVPLQKSGLLSRSGNSMIRGLGWLLSCIQKLGSLRTTPV